MRGSTTFCQLIGIFEGSEPDPFLTSLFVLLWKKVVSSYKKTDLGKKRVFSNIFRCTNELSTLYNNKNENDYDDIYHDELEHKKESEGYCKASFLDVLIEVHYRNLELSCLRCILLLYQSHALFGYEDTI